MLKPSDLTLAVQRAIRTISILVILALFEAILGSLPGVNLVLLPGITVLMVLRLVMVLIVLGVLVSGLPAIRLLVAHYVADLGNLPNRVGWVNYRGNYLRLVGNLLYLLSLLIICALVWPSLSTLVGRMRGSAWIGLVAALIFLVIGLYLLYAILQQIRPLTDLLSSSLASNVTGIKPAPQVCPRCGTRSAPGAEFCLRCGASLDQAQRGVNPTCAQCNKPLPAEAAFCPSCGAPAAREAQLPAARRQQGKRNHPRRAGSKGSAIKGR